MLLSLIETLSDLCTQPDRFPLCRNAAFTGILYPPLICTCRIAQLANSKELARIMSLKKTACPQRIQELEPILGL